MVSTEILIGRDRKPKLVYCKYTVSRYGHVISTAIFYNFFILFVNLIFRYSIFYQLFLRIFLFQILPFFPIIFYDFKWRNQFFGSVFFDTDSNVIELPCSSTSEIAINQNVAICVKLLTFFHILTS